MRPALYALLFAQEDAMRNAILSEEKQITIREGHRDYRVGRPVMLCCHLDPFCVMADITNVRHTTLAEVTEDELIADGFKNRQSMLEEMKRFYPNLNWDSPVTVICWNNVRGKLKDQWENGIGPTLKQFADSYKF